MNKIQQKSNNAREDLYELHRDAPDGFRILKLRHGDCLFIDRLTKNNIIAILDGICNYSHNADKGKTISNCMVLLTPNQSYTFKCLSNLKIVVLAFDALLHHNESILMSHQREESTVISVHMQYFPITKLLANFFFHLCQYMESGLNNSYLTELKRNELFFLMTHSTDSAPALSFLSPLVGQQNRFRHFVTTNYSRVRTADELIAMSSMCRTNFYKKFQEEFGMTVHRWLSLQKARKIQELATQYGMNVKTLMGQSGFISQSNFVRFCRTYFGCPPLELIRTKGRVATDSCIMAQLKQG